MIVIVHYLKLVINQIKLTNKHDKKLYGPTKKYSHFTLCASLSKKKINAVNRRRLNNLYLVVGRVSDTRQL